ncbi:MAG: tol-pal system protein YbgF [Acidobacteriota bacterium]|jgi:tol-pal system protein YbgF
MQQRVTESENRAQTLEAQVADLQATQQDMINTITLLRADLEAALDPIRAQQASGGADLRQMQTQITSLQEQVRILTDQLATYQATDVTPATGTPTGVTAGPDAPAGGGTAMPPAGGGRNPSAAPTSDEPAASEDQALFNAAYADYTAGQYVVAVGGFEELVQQYPDSPRAPDALYWIGESLAAQDQHAEARRRFLDVTQSYPGSPKVPDAMLRAALEAVEMGQIDDAVRELRQLVAAHGASDAALIGCMQLDRLGQDLPAGCRRP